MTVPAHSIWVKKIYGIWMMPADAKSQQRDAIIGSRWQWPSHRRRRRDGYLSAPAKPKFWWCPVRGITVTLFTSLNNDEAYLGSFRISDHPDLTIDGSEETDGLAVSSVNFGGAFSEGMLVVQDGYNKRPRENQNFKLVPWTEDRSNVY